MRKAGIALALALLAVAAVRAGFLPEDAPIPGPGEAGAPHRPLASAERERFVRGRALFDRTFFVRQGVGPTMNCDSCSACHLDPVVGGSGGIDLQVQRPILDDGTSPLETGALAHLKAAPGLRRTEVPDDVHLVEERNSPTLLGLGLLQQIPASAILAREDPTDADGDGIRGIAHRLPDGTIGRLGWKCVTPDLKGFVRDAFGNEMGLTTPPDPESPFGLVADGDTVQDPEVSAQEIDDMTFFLELLDFPPRLKATAETQQGEQLFLQVGCAKCHAPSLGGVEAFTDLLLHDVQPPGFEGVTQGQATPGLYRTAPLRGLRDTAPYFHDGRSPTVEEAVRRHDGEALAVRQAFEALTPTERAALIAFLLGL
jgi:CxxC motif-containing protein (DUF1111 family)